MRVSYEAERPQTNFDAAPRYVPKEIFGRPAAHTRGDPKAAFAQAPVRVEQTYRTPTEHHNPLETHGTIAQWNGARLTMYDSSQWAFGVQRRMAKVFGIAARADPRDRALRGRRVRVKGTAWSHVALAAMAARLVDRPVKLLVTRPQMFGWVGHRPQTEQHVALGATRDGKLVSVTHDVLSETSESDEFVEPCGVFSRDLYAVEQLRDVARAAALEHQQADVSARPGRVDGLVRDGIGDGRARVRAAPRSARASLAQLLRGRSRQRAPYSSKHLRECYLRAAQRFAWQRRNPTPRAMRDGRLLVGLGMATASRATHWSAAKARIRMGADGAVVVESGTIEQGCGSSTVYAQLAAEMLGMPYERVRFDYGDTNLPEVPIAAGSQTAGSVGSAVVAARNGVRERLASLNGAIPPGGIVLEAEAAPKDEDEERYATQAFGAHFAEVEVDPDLGKVRVTRFVGAFDAGRILNAKTANSQLLGGVVWGISMALFEKTRFDARTARIMNANLSDYLVPTNADIPNPELITIEDDDQHANPAGVKGIGEVGISGSAPAVANAVYNATGVRVRTSRSPWSPSSRETRTSRSRRTLRPFRARPEKIRAVVARAFRSKEHLRDGRRRRPLQRCDHDRTPPRCSASGDVPAHVIPLRKHGRAAASARALARGRRRRGGSRRRDRAGGAGIAAPWSVVPRSRRISMGTLRPKRCEGVAPA